MVQTCPGCGSENTEEKSGGIICGECGRAFEYIIKNGKLVFRKKTFFVRDGESSDEVLDE